MSDVCGLCGLSAKEHKNMECDKRRGFHPFEDAARQSIAAAKAHPAAKDQTCFDLKPEPSAEALALAEDWAADDQVEHLALAIDAHTRAECHRVEMDRASALAKKDEALRRIRIRTEGGRRYARDRPHL